MRPYLALVSAYQGLLVGELALEVHDLIAACVQGAPRVRELALQAVVVVLEHGRLQAQVPEVAQHLRALVLLRHGGEDDGILRLDKRGKYYSRGPIFIHGE